MKNNLFISCEIHSKAEKISDILRKICNQIQEKNFDMTKYSSQITDVGIIVNCYPDDYLLAGFGKPRKYISYQKGSADIRLPVPYIEFRNADEKTRYLMIVKNIVESVKVIQERCLKSKRAEFDGNLLISDILEKLEIDSSALENISGVLQKMPE
ncbi:MAG: hypothetical protein IJ642_07835 [Oscillospiraceae bacterium]|nr:hypothetical protein [Oscillospiraceae bacterium]